MMLIIRGWLDWADFAFRAIGNRSKEFEFSFKIMLESRLVRYTIGDKEINQIKIVLQWLWTLYS